MRRTKIGIFGALTVLALAACGSTPPVQHTTDAPGPPAADLSDIDRYVDADPYKLAALEDWVEKTTLSACNSASIDSALRDQVRERSQRGRRADPLRRDSDQRDGTRGHAHQTKRVSRPSRP